MNLNDIFPAVEIVDYSFYLFISIVIGVITLVYLAYSMWKKRVKGIDYYLNIIESTLHTDAKQTAYRVEYYGENIVKTPEQKERLLVILEELKAFKYVPNGTLFEKKTEKKLKDFLQSIRQENV